MSAGGCCILRHRADHVVTPCRSVWPCSLPLGTKNEEQRTKNETQNQERRTKQRTEHTRTPGTEAAVLEPQPTWFFVPRSVLRSSFFVLRSLYSLTDSRLIRPNSRSSSFDRSSSTRGRTRRTCTTRSPRVRPRIDGAPRSRSRSRAVPIAYPAECAGAPDLGRRHLTRAPNAASWTAIGNSAITSSPSRRNRSCGRTSTSMTRSPAGASRTPAWPFAGTRTRPPSAMPAGNVDAQRFGPVSTRWP